MTPTDTEREIHIEDSAHQWRMAYERFQMHGLPADRDEALQHLHRMNEAILGRSAAVQAQRHAEFERRLAEGIDYYAMTDEAVANSASETIWCSPHCVRAQSDQNDLFAEAA